MELKTVFQAGILVLCFAFGCIFGYFADTMAMRYAENVPEKSGGAKVFKGNVRKSWEGLFAGFLLGMVFLSFYLRFGTSVLTLRCMGLSMILMGVSLIDLKCYRIPNSYILSGLLLWLLTLPFLVEGSIRSGKLLRELKESLAGGAGIFLFLFLLTFLFSKVRGKKSLGGGDLKLFFLVGLYLKPVLAIFFLLLSGILGLLFSLFRRQRQIPFGPAISLAFFFTIVLGPEIIRWYSGI